MTVHEGAKRERKRERKSGVGGRRCRGLKKNNKNNLKKKKKNKNKKKSPMQFVFLCNCQSSNSRSHAHSHTGLRCVEEGQVGTGACVVSLLSVLPLLLLTGFMP